MNLVVDIGNSSIKLAVFSGKNKVSVTRINELTCEEIEKKLSGYKIDRAIVSSVRNLPPFMYDLLFPNIQFTHILSHKSMLPFVIDYETPETLGTDRVAAMAGAFNMYPDSDIMVIDAGTAITFDFLSGNVYKGGNISPGLMMRFRALNKFTAKLPLVYPKDDYISPGRNTGDAIAAGVITGMIYEINEYIRTFEKMHKDAVIIITGGDSEYLKNKVNHQVTYMPDIVIDGLNFILDYNAK